MLASVHAQSHVLRAVRDAGAASPGWAALAAAGFLSAALASATAWWSALNAHTGRMGFLDTTSRYAVGCLVNTFVPAHLGDAVRVGLLSRAFESRERVLTTTGVFVFLGVARAAALTLVLAAAAVSGVLPGRLLALPACLVVVAVGVVLLARRRARGRLAALLDSLRPITSPRACVRILGWLVLGACARVGAAAASAAALGFPRPLVAAAIIVPALEVSNLLPLTPGNFGITSAVVAVALNAQGFGMAGALAVGIAFHAIETIVGVSFGLAGALAVIGYRFPFIPRVAVAGGVLVIAVAVGGVFGMLPDVA